MGSKTKATLSLPRVLWPLLAHIVPESTVESLEKKITSLGLPSRLSSAVFYRTSNILLLPFSGLTEQFMVALTREALQYRDSRDQKVSTAFIEVQTGRKWRPERAAEVAGSCLRQKGWWPSGELVWDLFSKDSSGQGPMKGETPANPGRGQSRLGRRASEQNSGAQAAESMNKVGGYLKA